MGKNPAFQFYPMDWVRDLGEQELEVIGAWIMIVCKLWWSKTRGKETLSLDRWAKYLRVDNGKAQELIDTIGDENIGCVTVANKKITIENRRMYAEFKEKELNRLRQKKYRETHSAPRPNGKVTPLSSSSLSSSSSETISGKPEKVEKRGDAEYKYKFDKIMDTFLPLSYLYKTPTGGECGQILKLAGDVGYAIVAILKSAEWGDKDNKHKYMPKIRSELSSRSLWYDDWHDKAKAENEKFNTWMSQEFGSSMQDVISKIGRKV